MNSPGKSKREADSKITVFKLLGSLNELGHSAIDEERMLEHFFTIAWRRNLDHPQVEYLIREVKNKIFLFIGCDFPDWFMRFVIRILTNRELSSKFNDYIVNRSDKQFPKLKNFLTHCGKWFEEIPHMDTDNAIAFVDQLSQKWLERKIHNKRIRYEGIVFMSYYHADVLRAKNLKNNFEEEGIKVWFDETNLPRGEHRHEIYKAIAGCKIFFPLISDNILNDPGSYARQFEWSSAEEILNFKKKTDQPFDIIPCIIDDTRRDDARIPDFMTKWTTFYLKSEKDRIINEIKKTLTFISRE
jgi:hypothetical protein